MRYPEGLFTWVDLTTGDTEAARRFYSGLFGWEARDIPTPMGPPYTMFSIEAGVVAGMGPTPPGSSMPATWSSYINVADLDRVASRVAGAGGRVVMPAMQVMDQGRMAMIADPSGAVVGLWQPEAHSGADVFNVPGSLTWNELQSRDLQVAMQFYTALLDWVWQPGPNDYWMGSIPLESAAERMNCGAMAMPEGVPAEVPSYWAVYFATEDCDRTMARAVELGGSIFLPAMEMGPGRFGGICDPTGGMFMVAAWPAPSEESQS